MAKFKAKKPKETSPVPDSVTTASDLTGERANNRVFYINLGILKYGTDDKNHAASVFFSLLLFVVIVGCVIALGFNLKNPEFYKEVFRWTTGTFLLVLGFALGNKDKNNGHNTINE